MLKKEDIEIRHAWADALESGEWPQAQNANITPVGCCCLGVAGCLGVAEVSKSPDAQDNNDSVELFAGLTRRDRMDLIVANDEWRMSFDSIAEALRRSTEPDAPALGYLLETVRDEDEDAEAAWYEGYTA